MPALDKVLLSHADPHPGPGLVTRDRRGEEVAAAQSRPEFRNGDERRQRHGSRVQRTEPVDVVQLESLDERAVDERRVRRGELQRGAPDAAGRGGVDRVERAHQDAAPFQVDGVERAAERVQRQQLDAIDHFRGDSFVAKLRHELSHAPGVGIVARLGGGRRGRRIDLLLLGVQGGGGCTCDQGRGAAGGDLQETATIG